MSQKRGFKTKVFASLDVGEQKLLTKPSLWHIDFSDRKFSQPIITNYLPQEQGIWNSSASLLFQKLFTYVMQMKSLSKTLNWNEIHR